MIIIKQFYLRTKMSIHEEDQENIWDTDQCAVDEVEKETIVNIPRVAKEFMCLLY